MTLDTLDWSDVESLRRAFARAERQLAVIQSKVERQEPFSLSDLVDIAQWFGIAQGVLSERAHALEQTQQEKTLNTRARVAGFYLQQDRRQREQCVLECLSAVSVAVLQHWVADEDRPLSALVGAAELYRRKLGPDPRTGSAESVVPPATQDSELDPAFSTFISACRAELKRVGDLRRKQQLDPRVDGDEEEPP